MRKMAIILIVLLLPAAIWAGPYNDVSFTFGHQAGLANIQGLNVVYGMNIGLTSRLETSVWGESTLTPHFFGDNSLGISLSWALMGTRSTGTRVPGSGINTYINAGIIASMHSDWGFFAPTTAYVSITPLTLGSPVIGRRERLFEVGVSYNWAQNRFGFFFSLFKFDYYVHGSWRDYV